VGAVLTACGCLGTQGAAGVGGGVLAHAWLSKHWVVHALLHVLANKGMLGYHPMESRGLCDIAHSLSVGAPYTEFVRREQIMDKYGDRHREFRDGFDD
jgi:hypothetical protein